MKDNYIQLKLEEQICFPLYAVSRLVIQQYQPMLSELGITYPQYLVFLVLWERDEIPVKDIASKLFLESNTLTPLLKRMETNGWLERNRSKKDERKVTISLTPKGKDLRNSASEIPEKFIQKLDCYTMNKDDVVQLKRILDNILLVARDNKSS